MSGNRIQRFEREFGKLGIEAVTEWVDGRAHTTRRVTCSCCGNIDSAAHSPGAPPQAGARLDAVGLRIALTQAGAALAAERGQTQRLRAALEQVAGLPPGVVGQAGAIARAALPVVLPIRHTAGMTTDPPAVNDDGRRLSVLINTLRQADDVH